MRTQAVHRTIGWARSKAWVGLRAAWVTVVLYVGGCNSGPDPVTKVFESLTPPSPSQVARDAFNVYDADARRKSVTTLSAASFGGEEPYLQMYRLLSDDPDPTVRAACATALGLHGTPEDAKLLTARLSDDSNIVRWEAAKALQKIHNPAAVGPLIRSLKDDQDADVRMAAADALGQYAEPRVFQALVGALEDRSFSVTRAAWRSLRILTGRDFGADGSPWLQWAREHEGQLFEGQRTYVWYPYARPLRLIDKVQFWKKPPRAQPQLPAGTPSNS